MRKEKIDATSKFSSERGTQKEVLNLVVVGTLHQQQCYISSPYRFKAQIRNENLQCDLFVSTSYPSLKNEEKKYSWGCT